MTKWEEFRIGERVQAILDEQQYAIPDHPLGRPFLSAYQIAIEFAARFPVEFERFGMQIGGEGLGEHVSFSQYIGRELSRKIKDGGLAEIQGGFLSNTRLKEIKFHSGKQVITSSMTGGQFDLSIFRSTRPVHF